MHAYMNTYIRTYTHIISSCWRGQWQPDLALPTHLWYHRVCQCSCGCFCCCLRRQKDCVRWSCRTPWRCRKQSSFDVCYAAGMCGDV